MLKDDPAVPKGNRIFRNIFHGGTWIDIKDAKIYDTKILEIHDNLTEGDPGFVDPARGNYALKANSPAWKLGFRQIPIEMIGLYRDEYRESVSGVE